MSTHFQVRTSWLHDAWFGVEKRELPIHMIVNENELKITTMTHHGAGLRTFITPISQTNPITLEVSDALRCFIKNCMQAYPFADVLISSSGLVISLDSAVSGVQYRFPKIKITEENVIPPHVADQSCRVPCSEWYGIWTTIPPKGECTISVSKQSKMMTFKHHGDRWAAALQMKSKPKKDAKIVIRSGVANLIFGNVPVSETWGVVVFMNVGVLRWMTQYTEMYIAPFEA